MRRWRLTAALGVALVLGGCGVTQIEPRPVFPKPLVTQLPAKVGLVLPADQRNYRHEETRGGVAWAVLLGAGQQAFARLVMGSMFREVREFPDRGAAAGEPDLQAVFEPHIEEYSFATAAETGGRAALFEGFEDFFHGALRSWSGYHASARHRRRRKAYYHNKFVI